MIQVGEYCVNFGGMCDLALFLVWFLYCIKSTYLKGDCKWEDRAALHQKQEEQLTWRALFPSFPPHPDCSQCFAWAHRISALPRPSFCLSAGGLWEELTNDSSFCSPGILRRHLICTTFQAREWTSPLLHPKVWMIRYLFPLFSFFSLFCFVFLTLFPTTSEISKTFFHLWGKLNKQINKPPELKDFLLKFWTYATYEKKI